MAATEYKLSDSGKLIQSDKVAGLVDWLLKQGPATLILACIMWWLYGQAPALFVGVVADSLAEQRNRYESFVEKTEIRHEKQLEKVEAVTASVKELIAEIKLDRIYHGTTKGAGGGSQ